MRKSWEGREWQNLWFSLGRICSTVDSPVLCDLIAPHQPMVKLGSKTFQAGAGRGGNMSQNKKNSILEEANFKVRMDLLK